MTAQKRPRPITGVYERPFWAYVQNDELRLQSCKSCENVRYPPAAVCPRCLSDAFEWKVMSGNGRVVSWAIFHRKYLDLPVPYTVVSVALEEGPMLIGNIGCGKGSLSLDMPVRVTFEDAVDEAGQPWRIFQWQKVE